MEGDDETPPLSFFQTYVLPIYGLLNIALPASSKDSMEEGWDLLAWLVFSFDLGVRSGGGVRGGGEW